MIEIKKENNMKQPKIGNGFLIGLFIVYVTALCSSCYLELVDRRDNPSLPKNNAWNRIKNKCEFVKTLDSGDEEFTCDNVIVIVDTKYEREIDDLKWNSFKSRNKCRLNKIDFTVNENTNQWLCNENITIYNNRN